MSLAYTRTATVAPDAGLRTEQKRGALPVRKIRVLHVIESLRSGGAENVVAALATHTDPSRFESEVVALASGGDVADRLHSAGVTVHILGKRLGVDLSAAARLRHLIQERQISIVHAHNPVANHWTILACLFMAGAPPILQTEHSIHYRGRIRLWYPFLRGILGLWNSAIVGCCTAVTVSHRRIDPLNRSRYRTVYNGIEPLGRPSAERRAALRREIAIPDGFTVAGTVGNLRGPKAHGDLLSALALLAGEFPRLITIIAGDGPLEQELRARAAALGIAGCVRWLGKRADVSNLLGIMDIFVLSSTREGFPVAVLEAISAGVPVVATDVGGVSEVIMPGMTGVLVPPGDPPALAAGIRSVLGDVAGAKHRAAMAHEAFDRTFTVEAMARSMESLYAEILDHAGRAVTRNAAGSRP